MIIRRATEADIEGIAYVHVKSWQSTYAGIIPEHYLHSLTIENRARNWQRHLNTLHTITFIAENATGDIIGFAIGGPEQTRNSHYQAEIYAIYILEAHQRRGIGKQLMKPITEILEKKNYENIIIWALEKNTNRFFYESLGGQIVATKSVSICGKELKEVGYGWNSISDLIRHF